MVSIPVDPVFVLIRRHQAAYELLDAMPDLSKRAADLPIRHEIAIWRELVATPPTTIAGLAAYASYLANYVDIEHQDFVPALRSISSSLSAIVGGQ
jgi:hypothetical protein